MLNKFQTVCASLAMAAAFTISAGSASAQNIDTTTAANQTIGAMAVPNTATWGQTITIPAGAGQITSFGFEMQTFPSVQARGAVYLWDDVNSHATGPALWESPVTLIAAPAITVVTFTPPAPIAVTAGQKYVILVTNSRDQPAQAGGTASFEALHTNPYSGGDAAMLNNGSDTAQWTTVAWDMSVPNRDLGVVVNFAAPAAPAAVPTMSEWAMILLGLGLAGGAALYLQRRRFAA